MASRPLKGLTETAAPPVSSNASNTSTDLFAFARYAALVKPLWPPPKMTQSNDSDMDMRLLDALRNLESNQFSQEKGSFPSIYLFKFTSKLGSGSTNGS